jgi:hypothetical protein
MRAKSLSELFWSYGVTLVLVVFFRLGVPEARADEPVRWGFTKPQLSIYSSKLGIDATFRTITESNDVFLIHSQSLGIKTQLIFRHLFLETYMRMGIGQVKFPRIEEFDFNTSGYDGGSGIGLQITQVFKPKIFIHYGDLAGVTFFGVAGELELHLPVQPTHALYKPFIAFRAGNISDLSEKGFDTAFTIGFNLF